MCMMPGRGEQSGIIWGGGIYERTERQIRDFSESVRDRQLFRGGRGIKLHTVRHQSDDGWIEEELEVRLFARVKKESYLQTTEPD